ncbi:hypothetical protein D5Y44_27540, partial [Klebsiella pneumoniae]|nr:hypothetical protein [Klebsiella pneumoniae]
MSQLSFADVFNMAREAADNSPVIQAGQQIAEMVPTVQRMMSEQYSRSRFIRVFKDTGRGTVAKLAMRQPFVLFKGLTFQKLCLPGAFRPGDHHNKMLRPG